ncbi:ADP-ribosylglycohydrolase family protein [Allokutzneria oryzae]|uniref:ADP-ribosylglycohydrolase family protein n=1 Tax=Allokutzneria oryzae TaxID=1378989 RepID=A0ABV6A2G7_9PSEU
MPLDPTVVADRGAGCLLGGALGDALGAPVEFMRLDEIRKEYGTAGVTHPPRLGLITDDTQMTLFTAEGYLRAWVRGKHQGMWGPAAMVWLSYRRWLDTQQQRVPDPAAVGLLTDKRLYASRAPGVTCLRVLQAANEVTEVPDPEHPINDSRGCGGVMRAAPAGFAPTAETAYGLGCEFAALTHGHPGGWAPGGALAMIVHLVAVRRRSLVEAVDQATGRVLRDDRETAHALAAATALAGYDSSRAEQAREAKAFGREAITGGPSHRSVERLGAGWLGPEALAIAVYAALSYRTPERFPDALRLAANHSGDSDSTAAITGNLLGAVHGAAALPREWVGRLELSDLIDQVGRDLAASCMGTQFDEAYYQF